MNYEIIDYSEKAIAVCGDTKAIKDELKSLGGRFNPRLSCGAGWVFPKSKREQLTALLNGESVAVTTTPTAKKSKGIDPKIKAEITAYYQKVWGGGDGHMVDYCVNKTAHAARLSNGLILTIEKPSIETSFCFGESGYDHDEAFNMAYNVAKTEEYFKNRNMREFDNMIANLKQCKKLDKWGCHKMYAYMNVQSYYGCTDRVICEVYTDSHLRDEVWEQAYGRKAEKLPDADIDTAIALFEEARVAFKKRVDAYWKRYGSSKLKTWTYWRDR